MPAPIEQERLASGSGLGFDDIYRCRKRTRHGLLSKATWALQVYHETDNDMLLVKRDGYPARVCDIRKDIAAVAFAKRPRSLRFTVRGWRSFEMLFIHPGNTL